MNLKKCKNTRQITEVSNSTSRHADNTQTYDLCNLPCVFAFFRLISIARYAFISLHEFAFEGQNMKICHSTI